MSNGMNWLKGCLIAFVVCLVIGIITIAAIVIYAKNQFDKAYSDAPTYTAYEPSIEETNALELKVKNIEQKVKLDGETLIVLDENELNTLISKHNDSPNIFVVSIQGDLLKVEASMRSQDPPYKYLNVAGTLSVETINGEIQVFLVDGQVGDVNLPQGMKDDLKNDNLAEGILADQDMNVEFLEAYVDDGKLYLKVKPKE